MPDSGVKRVGPYVVEGELGRGGMGVVYVARHQDLPRVRYAVKVLNAELSDAVDVSRFQREFEAIAAVSAHPNVVTIHAAGHDRGRLYYAMDLVAGADLTGALEGGGALAPRRAAALVRDVARAVAVMHDRGILHRDIKPANVIVDESGAARLMDFGLAKLAQQADRLTRTGEVIGTPHYMAPEQALGVEVGPPADVYALGMLLYALLAGRPAVSGKSALEIMSNVAQGKLVPLAESAPDVPLALAQACAWALRFDAARRPKAGELVRALDAYLDGGRAADGPLRRRRGGRRAALAAGLALALGAGGAAVAYVASRPDGGERGGGDASPPEPESPGELAVAAEAALAAGDPAEARRLRAAAEAAAGRPTGALGERLRALEAGLAAVDPRPDDDLHALRAGLRPALERWPERLDLRAWQVSLSLRLGAVEEAVAIVRGLGERAEGLPVALRGQVLAAAGELEAAVALAEAAADPAARGAILYRVGRARLEAEEGLDAAIAALDAAVAAAPEHPLRAEVAAVVAGELEEPMTQERWQRLDPSARAREVYREIGLHWVRRRVDPAYAPDPAHLRFLNGGILASFEVFDDAISDEAPRRLCERVFDLSAGPEAVAQVASIYAGVVGAPPYGDVERRLAYLGRGVRAAAALEDEQSRLLEWPLLVLVRILVHVGRGEALADLDDELAGLGVGPADRLPVLVGRARLRREAGDLEAALALVEEGIARDPDDLAVRALAVVLHEDRVAAGEEGAEEAARAAGWTYLDRLRPAREAVRGDVGRVATLVGRLEEAADRPERALAAYEGALAQHDDDHSGVALARLRLLLELGRPVSAADVDDLEGRLADEDQRQRPGVRRGQAWSVAARERLQRARALVAERLRPAVAAGDPAVVREAVGAVWAALEAE